MVIPREDLWARAREVLEQLLELPPEQRAERMDALTGGEGPLHAEVASLLACDPDDSFLEAPIAAAWPRPGSGDAPDTWVGKRLGPYVVERELAAGGMGAVFLARRADGAFEQTVAIKLIKRGMDSDSILERFRQERQVLASLEHPSIARLVDGNAHSDGRPYLVMEFVEGEPIDRYCAENELGLEARIGLFLRVCAAVQHAHERLVVHRDIKPANILVTAAGAPKLLDFGLAKLLAPDGRERDLELTAEGERLLTPVYAAPEQIRGENVTTATDVYALGVLLYELLSGVRPYELAGRPWAEVERLVCVTDPPPPSAARRRGSQQAATGSARALAGDLDLICLTALRKEPERRYRSVDRLASDLERFLKGLPIEARPATLRYRAAKFVGRNRVLTGSVAALSAVLVVSGLIVARQMRATHEALRETQAALANAAAVNGFMRGVILAADPRDQGIDVEVRDAVELAAERSLADLSGLPEADVRSAIGTAQRTFGQARKARDQLAIASAIQLQELGPDDLTALHTLHELALAQRELGQFDEAQASIRTVIEGRERVLGRTAPDTISAREVEALLAMESGDAQRAHDLFEGVHADFAATMGADAPNTLVASKHLANTYRLLGRREEATELLAELWERQARALGEDHLDTLVTRIDLASALVGLQRLEEAEEHYVGALADLEPQVPPEYLSRVIAMGHLAGLYTQSGRHDEALELGEPLYELCLEHFGADHPLTGMVRAKLAQALRGLGLSREAEELEGG